MATRTAWARLSAGEEYEMLSREAARLEDREILVETNAGTYSDHEAGRKVGCADPAFASYYIYERVGGGRRHQGCDPAEAPGYPRHNRAEMSNARRALAGLRRQMDALRGQPCGCPRYRLGQVAGQDMPRPCVRLVGHGGEHTYRDEMRGK